MNQYYQMSLDEAISLSKKGFISNYGLLLFYIKITFKKGWRIKLVEEKVRSLLNLSKTQYRRALKAIAKNFPEFSLSKYTCDVLTEKGTKAEGRGQNAEGEENNKSEVLDKGTVTDQELTVTDRDLTLSDREETVSVCSVTVSDRNMTTSDREITVSDREKAETPNKNKTNGDRADYIHSSFHSFFQSLSQEEREDFLAFVREKTIHFPKAIVDYPAWLAATNKAGNDRWREYYNLYESRDKAQSKEIAAEHCRLLKEEGRIQTWKFDENGVATIASQYMDRLIWQPLDDFVKISPSFYSFEKTKQRVQG